MGEKSKRRLGDRWDGKQIRDLDSMHIITSILYPNRCDNEAYINETVEMAPIRAYVEKKNQEEGLSFPYTPFHIMVTALLKTLILRPKMNRFVANRLMYQRNETSVSFVVKKLFTDDSEEALAIIKGLRSDDINTIHEQLFKQISGNKSGEIKDESSKQMDIFSSFPVRIVRLVVRFICWLDRIGKCPKILVETDPYYTSCVMSNVGSIKLKSGYHHLTNWGTCSLFCMIGEVSTQNRVEADGSITPVETVKIGLTVDERLADGYYYSKTVRLFKHLLANPELLELPLGQQVEY